MDASAPSSPVPVVRGNVAERRMAPPPVAVSTVIFALRREAAAAPGRARGALALPLVRRTRPPYCGDWALPGGPIAWDESLAGAAGRTLDATTRLRPRYLEQLYAFGGLDRAADLRLVSIVYWALVSEAEAGQSAPADNVTWFPAGRLPALAFDHGRIVEYALMRLRTKMEYSSIAHAFLGDEFTLAELRGVYEAVLDREIDPANFRRDLLASGLIEPTGRLSTGGRHRPAKRYRYCAPARLTPEAFLAEPELADLSERQGDPNQ